MSKKVVRKQAEIVARIKDIEEEGSVFRVGFAKSDLIEFLWFNHAKPYLKESVTKAEWDTCRARDPIKKLKDYMPFAWEKALGERGLSAGRNLVHMAEWLWLAGDDEMLGLLDSGLYGYYGTAALKAICEKYELPMEDSYGSKFEDHVWDKDR
jgi:hypothetical protein